MPVSAPAVTTLKPGQLPAITENAWGRTGQFTREFAAFLWLIGLVLAAYLVALCRGDRRLRSAVRAHLH